MSMCMRVAARHIYHYFVAIIINIITSSSSLSSTSHLYIVALFGITEQCANICVYVQKNEHMIACMYIYVKCVSRQFVENHHKDSVHERKSTQ